MTFQHTTTGEQVTLIEVLNVYNGLGIKHYRLRRSNGTNFVIPVGEFKNNYKEIVAS